LVRADSGFARDDLIAWCEANGADFLFGLAKNDRLIAIPDWINEKVVIVDGEITWFGSLNPLSHTNRTDEMMARIAARIRPYSCQRSWREISIQTRLKGCPSLLKILDLRTAVAGPPTALAARSFVAARRRVCVIQNVGRMNSTKASAADADSLSKVINCGSSTKIAALSGDSLGHLT
jgi:Transposase DDE domain group 1